MYDIFEYVQFSLHCVNNINYVVLYISPIVKTLTMLDYARSDYTFSCLIFYALLIVIFNDMQFISSILFFYGHLDVNLFFIR